MSLPRFFLDSQVLSEESDAKFLLQLSEEDLHHARVLRLKPGEHIAVIDGSTDYFECKVESLNDSMIVSIGGREDSHPSKASICVYQALAKGDKVESVIRHATEVGATAFVPFVSSRSVVKLDGAKAAKKLIRWESVAKSAAMQSGRELVPKVHPVETFSQACESLRDFDCVIIFWEEAEATRTLPDALDDVHQLDNPNVAIVVGPEGGLSEEEVDALLSSNPDARLVSLGPTILRTETAGIVGCALVSYELGGMGARRDSQ